MKINKHLRILMTGGLIVGCLRAASAATFLSSGTPTLDGTIDGSYTHALENPHSGPIAGGSVTDSDFINETSSRYQYNGATQDLGSNRADVQQTYATWDANNLYLGITGPSVMYNDFNNASGPDHDLGDLFLAIDAGSFGSTASGSLASNAGWGSDTSAGFGGAKGVDFDGWTPNYVIGVQYVDNGGGGGGNGEIVDIGGSSSTSEAQNQNNGGFDWYANTSTIGTLEFAIPWTLLGYGVGFDPTQVGSQGTLRFAAYTTYNDSGWDAYDSGPGQGNGSNHEQVGDFEGDTDGSFPDTDNDGGLTLGTQPGSNHVGIDSSVDHGDEVDTIEQYWEFDFGTQAVSGVPEPGTTCLIGIGALLVQLLRSRCLRIED